MKDREHLDDVVVANEIDCKREAPHKDAASLQENGCICERIVRCPFDRGVEFKKELDTQPRMFGFVPCRRLVGLSLRVRLNLDRFQARRSFASN